MDSRLNLDEASKIAWQHAALVLSKKIGVGSKKHNEDLKALLGQFGSIANIYQHHFGMVPIDPDIVELLDNKFSKINFKFKVLQRDDNLYPSFLKTIYGIPPVYYYRGDLELLSINESISFVGTRNLDEPSHVQHGIEVITRLFNAGYKVIVSGLAKGSDTLGHKTAIELGGRTIAVLGTPLDISYPAENKTLQNTIATDHLLISEYPIGVGSFGAYFANRNLTTVSLSRKGIVVARAGDKSGTQYAIRTCIEQGKPVYILENNIYESDFTWVAKYKEKIKVIRKDK
ncbi:DNA-processing protein DprA [Dickeya dadantii]|uniref:DNA-processing protein DprA n=1 Tax=Dickeya dadantii TaxID=204038 RepID=UPI001C0B477F|nr:DNA-processing protein DprA [Dickeya dadantii]QWT40143.1 DNA-protecting protein DprA [Dickeya dadantii]